MCVVHYHHRQIPLGDVAETVSGDGNPLEYSTEGDEGGGGLPTLPFLHLL